MIQFYGLTPLTGWAFDFQLVRPATAAKALKRKEKTMSSNVQLELNLTPRGGNCASIETWKYRFTKSAMVEELGSTRYIYGLWDKLFGCWKVDTRTSRPCEIIPTWPPLNLNGVWRDHYEIRATGVRELSKALPPRWRYEANAAFAGLFWLNSSIVMPNSEQI